MSGINTITGQIVDTGVADESQGHGFVESPGHARDQLAATNLQTSISYSDGWGVEMEGTEAMYIQDYNFVLGSSSYPATNPVIVGVSGVAGSQLGQYPPVTGDYFYAWYSTGASQTCTLYYQDWMQPGTYTASASKSFGNNDGTPTLCSGTATIYAVAGATRHTLFTLDSSNRTNPSSFSFDSITTFGVSCPFQIVVLQSNMNCDYSGITNWSQYTINSPGPDTLNASGSGCPPAGLSWNYYAGGGGAPVVGDTYMVITSTWSSGPPSFEWSFSLS